MNTASLLQALSLRLPKKQAAMLLASAKEFQEYRSPIAATYEARVVLKNKIDKIFATKNLKYLAVRLENGEEWRSEEAGKIKKAPSLFRFLNANTSKIADIIVQTNNSQTTKNLKKELQDAIDTFMTQKIKESARTNK